jgi:DUF1365 family protein
MRKPAPFAHALEGRTTHVRYTPFERRFSYRLAQVSVDIDRLADTAAALRLFSYNRFNLFAFHDRDHGDRSGAPLRPWAEAQFARAGVSVEGGRIDLMCFPRMLGFVFNPLSVYFGYDLAGRLAGLIYEVNNTFGETHAYVAAVDDAALHAHETEKAFHVSPLFAVDGDYRFKVSTPGRHFRLSVENHVAGARTHIATLVSEARPLTDAWLARIFLTMPLMTLQVVLGIHWQALKLFLRGARYHRRPPLPAQPTSVARRPVSPRPEPALVDHAHD